MGVLVLNVNNEHWAEVVAGVATRGIEVTHAFTHDPVNLERRLRRHGACGIEVLDSSKYFSFEEVSRRLGPGDMHLPREVLEALRPAEATFLSITDRAAILPRSVRWRTRLFRALVRHWIGFVERTRADLLLCTEPPHYGWDLVLYEVMRYLGKPTRVLLWTHLPDRFYLAERYDQAVPVDPEATRGLASPEALRASLDPDLLRGIDEESRYSRHSRLVLGTPAPAGVEAPAKGRWQGARERIGRFAAGLGQALADLGREGFLLPFAHNGIRSLTLFRAFRLLARAWARRLERAWSARVRPLEPGVPYVYFALHMQPEASSMPQAGIFADQLLAVTTLAAALPEGWVLAVREHPSQFQDHFMSPAGRWHFRDPSDYEELAKVPGVVLVSMETPTHELVAGSRLVATLTGTVGWEALRAGRPCLTFGTPWYSGCGSVFPVDSEAACREALARAMAKTPADIGLDLLRFLVGIRDRLAVGAHGGFADSASGEGRERRQAMAATLAEGARQALAAGRPAA